jgi:hypothetical protein
MKHVFLRLVLFCTSATVCYMLGTARDEQNRSVPFTLSYISSTEQTSIDQESKEVAITMHGGGTFGASMESTTAPTGASVQASESKSSSKTTTSDDSRKTPKNAFDAIPLQTISITKLQTITLKLPRDRGESLGYSLKFEKETIDIIIVRERMPLDVAARYTIHQKTGKNTWQKLPYEIIINKSEAKTVRTKQISLLISVNPAGLATWAEGSYSLISIQAPRASAPTTPDVESHYQELSD